MPDIVLGITAVVLDAWVLLIETWPLKDVNGLRFATFTPASD